MADSCFTAEYLLCPDFPFEDTCVINLLFIQLLNKLTLLWDMEVQGSLYFKPSENKYQKGKDVGLSFLDYLVFFLP